MNAGGEAFPSRTTIAKGASPKPRAIDRAVAALESCGLLAVTRTEGFSNRYQALVPVSSKTRVPGSREARVPASLTTGTSVLSRQEPVSSKDTLRGSKRKEEADPLSHEPQASNGCFVCGHDYRPRYAAHFESNGSRLGLVKDSGQWWCDEHYVPM